MKNNITLIKRNGREGLPENQVLFQRNGNRVPYFADTVIYSQVEMHYNYGIQEDSGAFLRYSAVYALMEKAYVVIFAIYFTVCV